MDLSGDSDEEDTGFQINKDYADRYNRWREKEELQKLKDRYGDIAVDENIEESSSSESEDEDAEALTEKLEADWLKTLTALRKKDPKIYDKNVQFYDEEESSSSGEEESKMQKKKKKEKPFLLKDYERDVILKKEGKLSEDESDDEIAQHLPQSYHKEQLELKRSFKDALDDSEDSDEEFFTKRKKTNQEIEKDNKDFNNWLELQPNDETTELAGINPWEQSDMDDGEKFLKDYILNKRYKDEDGEDRIPTYDEIVKFNVEEDEQELEKEEEFERKFNFRYEEPDQDFIKTYPRTIGESVRRQENKRSKKRQEARDKRSIEQEQRKQEIRQLKNLKKREMMQKIDMIKEVTGKDTIQMSANDIEEDFDPDKYDKMMHAAFNEDYYDEDADQEKPVFPHDDDDDDILHGNWDNWVSDQQDNNDECEPGQNDDLNGDDMQGFGGDNYNDPDEEDEWDMTCISKKKRRKRSRLAKALMRKKPVFDPNDKTFEEYLDEYYKLDYEDMVAGKPCRFKYRTVVANDFGLSTDDVLKAPERELNQWVSVKRMSQYRTKEEEIFDVKVFQKRAKKKLNVLHSLNDADKEKTKASSSKGEGQNVPNSTGKNGNKKKRKRSISKHNNDTREIKSVDKEESNKQVQSMKKEESNVQVSAGGFIKKQKLSPVEVSTNSSKDSKDANSAKLKKKNKKKKQKMQKGLSDDRLKAYGINPKKFKYMKDRHKNK